MIGLVVFIACLAAALGAGALASWSDFCSLTIPNRYPVVIVVAFVGAMAAAYFSGTRLFVPPLPHLAAGALVFAVTFIMFLIKLFGGGDSKLLSAFALWTGFAGLIPMLAIMAVAGGMIGIVALFILRFKPFRAPRPQGWVGRLQAGENRVPYGIAITVGAVAAFLQVGYFSPEKLAAFVGGGGS